VKAAPASISEALIELRLERLPKLASSVNILYKEA